MDLYLHSRLALFSSANRAGAGFARRQAIKPHPDSIGTLVGQLGEVIGFTYREHAAIGFGRFGVHRFQLGITELYPKPLRFLEIGDERLIGRVFLQDLLVYGIQFLIGLFVLLPRLFVHVRLGLGHPGEAASHDQQGNDN